MEIITPDDPSRTKACGRRSGNFAISYQPQLHLQIAEGLPLVHGGTLVATPLNCLLVLNDGPIKTLADLKGGKIGFSVAGVEEALLTGMLGRHGVNLANIR